MHTRGAHRGAHARQDHQGGRGRAEARRRASRYRGQGIVARRLPSGVVTYGLRYRAGGKQRWLSRWSCTAASRRIRPGGLPRSVSARLPTIATLPPSARLNAPRPRGLAVNTVDALSYSFLERHVRKNLRSAEEVERIFEKYVRPRIGAKAVSEIRRGDVVGMLDASIRGDGNGPVMADRVLAWVRKAFNWHASRDDSSVLPIVRGMARTKPTERARKRILADDEIRDVWAALDDLEASAGLLRTCAGPSCPTSLPSAGTRSPTCAGRRSTSRQRPGSSWARAARAASTSCP